MAKKKILVVDDEEILIKTMNRLLEKKGYEVYSTKNGGDAEVLVEDEPMDLILCDIRMPGRNGVEIIRGIRERHSDQGVKAIPVIFITGFADPKLEQEARALHPVAYLTKPFDLDELMGHIERALR